MGAELAEEGALSGTRLARVGLVVAAIAILGIVAWKVGSPWVSPTSEEALAQRAQLFWDLRVAGDTLGAYELMSATYRKRVSAAQFSREGGRVLRTGAKVNGVKLDEKGGLVEIELTWRFTHPSFAELDQKSTATERWVLEDGAWYRWPPGL